jgi:hypothetical protein
MTLPKPKKKSRSHYFSVNKVNYGFRKSLYSENEFFRVLERERERANRNKHHFSLIVFELGLTKMDQATLRSCLNEISKRIRLIDEIGWYGPDCLGIILPYTSSRGARKFAESMIESIYSRNPISACTIVTYPPGGDVDKQEQPLSGRRS